MLHARSAPSQLPHPVPPPPGVAAGRLSARLRWRRSSPRRRKSLRRPALAWWLPRRLPPPSPPQRPTANVAEARAWIANWKGGKVQYQARTGGAAKPAAAAPKPAATAAPAASGSTAPNVAEARAWIANWKGGGRCSTRLAQAAPRRVQLPLPQPAALCRPTWPRPAAGSPAGRAGRSERAESGRGSAARLRAPQHLVPHPLCIPSRSPVCAPLEPVLPFCSQF